MTIIAILLILFGKEHSKSTSRFMKEDAELFRMPNSGGEGKSVIVVGGGISGLSAAKYLLDAGFSVTLLEKKDSVGGNNTPYLENGKHYATTVIITLPAQQPHYLQLCREYNIKQTPHKFSHLEGEIVMEDRVLRSKMGAGFFMFLKSVYKEFRLLEIIEGLKILLLFYIQFKIKPESKKSVKDVLGDKLVKASVFTHLFMPWIGINTWCRFEDIERQPAHIFGAFIFEYGIPNKMRYKNYLKHEDGWCVLDGRLIHKIEEELLKNTKYKQLLNTDVQNIKRDSDNKLIITTDKKEYICDYTIVATQPFQALPTIKDSAPKKLINELAKWNKMDCFVILHADFSSIKNMPWLHQTHKNKDTNKYYITNTIKPIMSDIKVDYVITFVYNQENYKDFISHNIDKSKIEKIYEPKLPIFTIENSINRNEIWKEIDDECTNIYWTQACRSGLQYHNNGILSSKRVVKTIIEKINTNAKL